MKDRSKRRKRKWKEATAFKEKGNMCLKKGLFKSAQKYYTDGLELRKDMMPLYTNRALARTKLEDWNGAVEDCTQVLEYCELFQDGFLKSKDLCYKALSRRGIAFRGLRSHELAIKDFESALELVPNQADCENLLAVSKEDFEMEERVSRIL